MAQIETRERVVEKVVIALLKAQPRLAPKTIVNEEKAGTGDAYRIVVKAEEGDRRLDGPGGYVYRVSISSGFGINQRNPEKLAFFDADFSAAEKQMQKASATSKELPPDGIAEYAQGMGVTYFDVVEDQSADKHADSKARRKSLNYTVHAAII